MDNYNNVLDQLVGYGLKPVLPLETGRLIRCAVEGSREKKGWYVLHDLPVENGRSLLVGSYGIWSGNDNGQQKIVLDKSQTLTPEQSAALKKRLIDDRKAAELARKKRAESAARKADSAWRAGNPTGEHEYLIRKNIQPYGARFSKTGALMVPMLDVTGKVHGIQFILSKHKHKEEIEKNGRDKQYWPPGVNKKGHFYQIGAIQDVVLVAEGFATAASLHAATSLPVIVAFDANNILPVCEEIKSRYKKAKFIICADDDSLTECPHCKTRISIEESANCSSCGEPHGKKNTGIESASLAALQINGHWIKPIFSDPDERLSSYRKNNGKLTDFNDLHKTDGLHTVTTQISQFVEQNIKTSVGQTRAVKNQGGGEKDLTPIDSTDELLERFSLIYGAGGTVFDHKEHCRVTLGDMRDACLRRDVHRAWSESPFRKIVRQDQVGFDPTGTDKKIICNLWEGWPTEPKKGNCELLLDLLDHMCSDDEVFKWVLKWLAYPLQHPGAKMRTCLVIHGPQGTGKNLFFECIMAIYGKYGRIIDQAAIEDKFNDWASKKLFLIADEVVARSDLYHVKNKLKAFITGEWIRINPKNMGAYEEKNHVNVVFLSNERLPTVLEEDDRRHAVIWTPDKLDKDFYAEVARAIQNGAIAALHDYLLNLPLGDFNEHSKPIMNDAKRELIELGKDPILRFFDQWISGDLDYIHLMPVLSEDLYELYRIWCNKQGSKPTTLTRFVDLIVKRKGINKHRKRFMKGSVQSNPKNFIFPGKGAEMNPGNSETAWLGECVEDFRESIKQYREGNYV